MFPACFAAKHIAFSDPVFLSSFWSVLQKEAVLVADFDLALFDVYPILISLN
jgi:hypothetical protein